MDARLEPYRTLVSFLGEALGPDYEVVLHDLTSEEGTIAAIVNNNISGRTEGAPLSNMALRFIHGRVYEKQPYVAGYQGASQAKGRLRSSTMFIKDGSELIGMLCINFDAAKYSRMAQELLPLCGAHQEPSPTLGVENFVSSLPDAVQAAITDVTGSVLPPDRLTMDEKIRIVDDLQQAGIFYMKGAVSEVAAQLGSSEATIYRYLSKLKD
ncbi:MAG: PAS domain-containing protein [Faecalibacterium prausnitzii]|nr:PAS domain-containing protein [Faecalibacterium prausnitzii]